jgi:hypothetical protein
MTKTHQNDNKLVREVKKLVQELRSKDMEPKSLPGLDIEKVLASSSLFELANDIRLGRTATRSVLKRVSKQLAEQVAQAQRDAKEGEAK